MPTTTLLELAKRLDFKLHKDGETVFGDFGGFKVTAIDAKNGPAFFIPVAGIKKEALAALSEKLEQNHYAVPFTSYEFAANFLAVYTKKPLLGAIDKLFKCLQQLINDLEQAGVKPNACLVCGEPTDTKAMYSGMYTSIHDTCLDKEGKNFTDDAMRLGDDDLIFITETTTEEPMTENNPIKKLADSMKDYQEPFVQDTVELCAIKSVKGPATDDAPYGKETVEALNWFLKRGEALGFKTVNVDNRAGYLEMGEGDEMVACVCHLDVVPAGDGWSSDPFVARIEDGNIIARGTSDDKGPALMGVYALKALLDDPTFKPTKRLRIIVGLDEESGSSCMAHYVKTQEIPVAGFTADAEFPAIYAEKGITRIELSMARTGKEHILEAKGGEALNMVAAKASFKMQMGPIRNTLDFKGIPAHASTPEQGENAITKGLFDIKERLGTNHKCNDPFADAFVKYVGSDLHGTTLGIDAEDESGRTTINVGMLSIDETKATVGIDVRYPVTFDIKSALAGKQEEMAADGIELTVVHEAAPLNLGKDSKLIQTLMKAYNDGMGTDEDAVAIGGGTYARAVPNIAAFGPGFPDDEHVAHQADEFISIERAMAAAAIYRDVFKQLAG